MRARMLLLAALAVVWVTTSTFRAAPAQAQSSCSVANFNVQDPFNWVFLYYSHESPCPLTCGAGEIVVGQWNNAGFAGYTCKNGSPPPPPPPSQPSINPGAACLAGSSRTVSLFNYSGDSHSIEINTGGILAGPNATFTGLLQGVDYQFRAESSNSGGSSGWTGWTAPVQQDLTAPTTSLGLAGTLGDNSYFTTNVSATLSATDSGCLGVASTSYTLDSTAAAYSGSFPVSGDGTHSLTFSSTDGAHAETLKSRTILIDTQAPSISVSPDRPADASGYWWRGPVDVSIAASDATSGVDQVSFQINGGGWQGYSGPIHLGEGEYTVIGEVVDRAGLASSRSISLGIDHTPPQTSIQVTGDLVSPGWYNDAYIITLSAGDNISGIAATLISIDGVMQAYTGPITLEGIHQISFASMDKAGNAEAEHVTMLGVDGAGPNVAAVHVFCERTMRGEITARIQDAASGLAHISAEITDPDGNTYAAPETYDFPANTQQADVTFTANTITKVTLAITDVAGHTTRQTYPCGTNLLENSSGGSGGTGGTTTGGGQSDWPFGNMGPSDNGSTDTGAGNTGGGGDQGSSSQPPSNTQSNTNTGSTSPFASNNPDGDKPQQGNNPEQNGVNLGGSAPISLTGAAQPTGNSFLPIFAAIAAALLIMGGGAAANYASGKAGRSSEPQRGADKDSQPGQAAGRPEPSASGGKAGRSSDSNSGRVADPQRTGSDDANPGQSQGGRSSSNNSGRVPDPQRTSDDGNPNQSQSGRPSGKPSNSTQTPDPQRTSGSDAGGRPPSSNSGRVPDPQRTSDDANPSQSQSGRPSGKPSNSTQAPDPQRTSGSDAGGRPPSSNSGRVPDPQRTSDDGNPSQSQSGRPSGKPSNSTQAPDPQRTSGNDAGGRPPSSNSGRVSDPHRTSGNDASPSQSQGGRSPSQSSGKSPSGNADRAPEPQRTGSNDANPGQSQGGRSSNSNSARTPEPQRTGSNDSNPGQSQGGRSPNQSSGSKPPSQSSGSQRPSEPARSSGSNSNAGQQSQGGRQSPNQSQSSGSQRPSEPARSSGSNSNAGQQSQSGRQSPSQSQSSGSQRPSEPARSSGSNSNAGQQSQSGRQSPSQNSSSNSSKPPSQSSSSQSGRSPSSGSKPSGSSSGGKAQPK